jgi:hypothetical protein
MSHRIYASFENRDRAEQAASRLRRKGVPFRFEIEDASRGGLSAAPPMLNLLYPTRFPNELSGFAAQGQPWGLGRASLSADALGLPLWPGRGETRACVTVDDEHYDEVRAVLVNCGGYHLR